MLIAQLKVRFVILSLLSLSQVIRHTLCTNMNKTKYRYIALLALFLKYRTDHRNANFVLSLLLFSLLLAVLLAEYIEGDELIKPLGYYRPVIK